MPSIVVMFLPVKLWLNIEQELKETPSSSTQQAPHSPLSQAILVPVKPSLFRNVMARVSLGSTSTRLTDPLIFSEISRSTEPEAGTDELSEQPLMNIKPPVEATAPEAIMPLIKLRRD